MKRLLLILFAICLLCTSSFGTINWVTFGGGNITNPSSGTPTNFTLTSFTGNVIVVGLCWSAGANPSITDNQSHTYTQVGTTVTQGAVSVGLWTTVVNYVTQPTQGTVSWGTGGTGVASVSFGNLSGVLAYGNAATNSGNGTTGGATITTQDSNNWLVNYICSGGSGTHSNGTGTRRDTGGSSPGAIKTIGTNSSVGAGSLTMSVTISTAQDFAVKGIELRTVAPSASCGHTLRILGAGCT